MPRPDSSGGSRNRRGSSRSDSARRSFDGKKGPSDSKKRPGRSKSEGSEGFRKSGSAFKRSDSSKPYPRKRSSPDSGGKFDRSKPREERTSGFRKSGSDFKRSDSSKSYPRKRSSPDSGERFDRSKRDDRTSGFRKSGSDFKRGEGSKPFPRKRSSSDSPEKFDRAKPREERSSGFRKPGAFKPSSSESGSFDRKKSGEERQSRFKNFNKRGDSKKPFGNKSRSSDPDKKFRGKDDSAGEERSQRPSGGSKSFTKKFDGPARESQSSYEKKESRSEFKKGFSEKRRTAGTEKISHHDIAPPQTEKIRLNKYIANSGVCSRREADELIKLGLISVNGKTITELGYKVNPGDEVRHESKVLKSEKLVYILMNKPKGYLTTTADPQERNTVMHIIGNSVKERIYPVGRLDRNTTGLLFLTNDGDLADKLMHPSYNAKKIYKAELDKPFTKADLDRMIEGVQLEEGRAMVDDVAVISEDRKTVGLEIHIGWNRVVRRIFEALDYQVVKLDRSVYAGLDKKDLPRGHWRMLTKEEIVRLKHFNQTKVSPAGSRGKQ